ncbi:MAG: SufE family protein [Bernardetiaceae bacterium]|nr:SufE family protein [Bernardetiaceae bacterium]
MSQSIKNVQDEIIEDFEFLESKSDKYNYIIELGKKLEGVEEVHKIDKNIIKGCQSKVWLVTEKQSNTIHYRADSDSILVRGLISLLIRILSGHTPEEVLKSELYFAEKIGLAQLLSMNRSNGLNAMIKQMKMFALAYQAQENATQKV